MKILFLSNPIQRDGAPLRLLEIIEYVKCNNRDIAMDVYADRIAIKNIYSRYINNLYIRDKEEMSLFNRITDKLLSKSGLKKDIIQSIAKNNYDIIYANTVVQLKKAIEVKKLLPQSKIILHLRELETVSLLYNRNIFKDILEVDRVIAISKSVYNYVTEVLKVDASKVSLIHSGTHLSKFHNFEKVKNAEIIIGTVGGSAWRKGFDLFVQTARIVCKKNPDIKFQWVGNIKKNDKLIYEADIRKLDLCKNIDIIDSTDDMISLMKNWFVFASFAREEPLGVAVIEAASLGLPVIAFKKSGGPEEILEDGGGLLVDYIDNEDFANQIQTLVDNPERYDYLSEEIKKISAKYDISNSLPKINNIITEMLKNS